VKYLNSHKYSFF